MAEKAKPQQPCLFPTERKILLSRPIPCRAPNSIKSAYPPAERRILPNRPFPCRGSNRDGFVFSSLCFFRSHSPKAFIPGVLRLRVHREPFWDVAPNAARTPHHKSRRPNAAQTPQLKCRRLNTARTLHHKSRAECSPNDPASMPAAECSPNAAASMPTAECSPKDPA